ncbi:MAG TPA: hypothetical protein VJV03_09225 [Pyrinomonadaceae bacterium]|nr:hypothetical protein [Pyrinomonadaceae bacterium]
MADHRLQTSTLKYPRAVAAVLLLLCFFGCGEKNQTSMSGKQDQWVRGNDLSIRVSFAEGKIDIRNDGSKEARVLPLTVRGWYPSFGQKEITMRSGQVEALKPGERLSLTIPPFLQMEPPPGGPFNQEPLNKLQLELGPSGSKEVFTVTAER